MAQATGAADTTPDRLAERPTLVYVASTSHSGSTLLDLLVSGHRDVVSVGEIRQLGNAAKRVRCTCPAASPATCPFWAEVDRLLAAAGAGRLSELDVVGVDASRFEADNLALLRAVAAVSGRPVVVDSSKSARRLRCLLSCGGIDLRVIHLLRSPFGVAYSFARKGRSPAAAAVRQAKQTLQVRWLLRRTPYLEVRYEQLAGNPAAALERVMRWLGLEAEPGQLRFAGRERHNLGGNRMRFAADNTIVPDVGWKRGLSPLQKALVAVASAPARLPGSGSAYALWRRLRRRGGTP